MIRSVHPLSGLLLVALMTSCAASERLYVERGTFQRHREASRPSAGSGEAQEASGSVSTTEAHGPRVKGPNPQKRHASPRADTHPSQSSIGAAPNAPSPPSSAQAPSAEGTAGQSDSPGGEVGQADERSRIRSGEAVTTAPDGPGASSSGLIYPGPILEALARSMNTAAGLVASGDLLEARPLWAWTAARAPGSLPSLEASVLLAEDALGRGDRAHAHGWLQGIVLPDHAPSAAGDLETLSDLVDRRDRLISALAALPGAKLQLREHSHDPETGETETVGDAQRVGVLLPLSGPHARYGKMAKRGLDLALVDVPFEVHTLDTAGEAQRAADAVRRLVEELDVIAIVGPIGRVETRAAATAAAELGVPLISLTSYEEAVRGSPFTVRIRLSPSEHARSVARHAVAELGLERLAVVHPVSRFGFEVLDAFWSEGRRLGATLGVVHGLERDGSAGAARRREATSLREASASAVAAAAVLSEAMVDQGRGPSAFEALFLPETQSARIREVVRVLHGRGVPMRVHPREVEREGLRTVQLLGLGGFNGRSAIDPGDHLTDNAIFAVGFAHDPERAENDRFVRSYLDRHGEKPKIYGDYVAAAYDGGNLVRALQGAAAGQPASPRRAARQALEKTRHIRGALGDRTLLPGGRLVGRSTLLTIQKDVIRVRLPEPEEASVRPRPRRPRKR